MKQTLQLKLTQHLTLTPQLQQSIRLLQLSTLELNAEVDRMLQENPLLEREDGDDDAPPQEFPLGTAPGPVTTERVTRDDRDADGDGGGDSDGDGMQGADAAPTRRPPGRDRFLGLRRRRHRWRLGRRQRQLQSKERTISPRSRWQPARCATT